MPSLRRISTALITGAAIAATTGMAIAASGSAGTADEQGAPITLSGSVEGLAPGAARDLTVTIANPNAKPLVIATIATSVTASRAACPAAALRVGDLASPVTVPASASAAGRLAVRLSADAPDACQGALFSLRFSAIGRGEGTLAAPAAETPAAETAGTTTAPAAPPATVKPSTAWKTITVKRRKRVCRTRRVRVRGVVHRRKVCRVVVVKVKVRVPR